MMAFKVLMTAFPLAGAIRMDESSSVDFSAEIMTKPWGGKFKPKANMLWVPKYEDEGDDDCQAEEVDYPTLLAHIAQVGVNDVGAFDIFVSNLNWSVGDLEVKPDFKVFLQQDIKDVAAGAPAEDRDFDIECYVLQEHARTKGGGDIAPVGQEGEEVKDTNPAVQAAAQAMDDAKKEYNKAFGQFGENHKQTKSKFKAFVQKKCMWITTKWPGCDKAFYDSKLTAAELKAKKGKK